jgi:hypothetical protein
VVWEDGRNGVSYDVYGLRLEAGTRIFLPVVVRGE